MSCFACDFSNSVTKDYHKSIKFLFYKPDFVSVVTNSMFYRGNMSNVFKFIDFGKLLTKHGNITNLSVMASNVASHGGLIHFTLVNEL